MPCTTVHRQSAQIAVSCRAWGGTREATLYTSRTILWLRMATVMSEEAMAKLGTPLETQKAACTTSRPSMCIAETMPTWRSVPMHTSDAYVYACARFIIATGRAALQAFAHEVSGRSGDLACFRHGRWTGGERFSQVAAPLRSGSRSAFEFRMPARRKSALLRPCARRARPVPGECPHPGRGEA